MTSLRYVAVLAGFGLLAAVLGLLVVAASTRPVVTPSPRSSDEVIAAIERRDAAARPRHLRVELRTEYPSFFGPETDDLDLWIVDDDRMARVGSEHRFVSTPDGVWLAHAGDRQWIDWEARGGAGRSLSPSGLLWQAADARPGAPRAEPYAGGWKVSVASTTTRDRAEAVYGPDLALRRVVVHDELGTTSTFRVLADEAGVVVPDDVFRRDVPDGWEVVTAD